LAGRKAGAGDESDAGDAKGLNFKVSPEFKKEFKVFAATEGISMTDLLKEGFALSKARRGR